MPFVLKVRKEDAERIRRKLVRKKLLASQWKIVVDGDYIYFPLKRKIDGSLYMDLPQRNRRKTPYERVKELVTESLGRELEIPDYWEKIGDVLLLPPFKGYRKHGKIVGEAFSRILKVKTVAIYHGVKGELREPEIEIIYGNDTTTVHLENGIKYALDISRIMFSSGNVEERIRMGKIDASGDIVVDMFAGIGYFTLPIAKYGGAEKIYACEKNPLAFHYLLKNLEINDVENVYPLLGDNRDVAPRKIAERVILGYVHTEKFLDRGIECLKEEGGIIHYHDTFTSEEKDWLPEEIIKTHAKRYGFKVEILYKRVIKSYAPHIWHMVVDAKLTPKN